MLREKLLNSPDGYETGEEKKCKLDFSPARKPSLQRQSNEGKNPPTNKLPRTNKFASEPLPY